MTSRTFSTPSHRLRYARYESDREDEVTTPSRGRAEERFDTRGHRFRYARDEHDWDSEDKVTTPSRTPSPSPSRADERFNPRSHRFRYARDERDWDSEDEVTTPSRTPSPSPSRADESFDDRLAELVAAALRLSNSPSRTDERFTRFRYAQEESDPEDEITTPSRTPSPSPSRADESFDERVAELVDAALRLSMSCSIAAPATSPHTPSLRKEIVTKKCPVLLLGESETRALSFALAAMRGSLKGIRATCFHCSASTSACSWLVHPPVDLNNAIGLMRGRIDLNNRYRYRLEGDDYNLPSYGKIIENCCKLHLDDDPLYNLTGELDGTRLGKDILRTLDQEDKRPLIIWFQCPWAPRGLEYDTAGLIRRFMQSAFALDAPGGIILVLGLVTKNSRTHRTFYHDYQIEDLKQIAKMKNFEHIEDRSFIRECILYGYRHCDWRGWESTHNSYLVNHVSHVFFKK